MKLKNNAAEIIGNLKSQYIQFSKCSLKIMKQSLRQYCCRGEKYFRRSEITKAGADNKYDKL